GLTSPRGDVHRYAVVRRVRVALRGDSVDRGRVHNLLQGRAGDGDRERDRSLVGRTADGHVMERAHYGLPHRAAPIWICKCRWCAREWSCGALNDGRTDIGERRRQRIDENDAAERAPGSPVLDLVSVREGGTYRGRAGARGARDLNVSCRRGDDATVIDK